MFSTFLELHGEQVQPLHPLLQLILCRGCHGVHIFITPVIVLVGVGGKHLQEETGTLDQTENPKHRVNTMEGSVCTVTPLSYLSVKYGATIQRRLA